MTVTPKQDIFKNFFPALSSWRFVGTTFGHLILLSFLEVNSKTIFVVFLAVINTTRYLIGCCDWFWCYGGGNSGNVAGSHIVSDFGTPGAKCCLKGNHLLYWKCVVSRFNSSVYFWLTTSHRYNRYCVDHSPLNILWLLIALFDLVLYFFSFLVVVAFWASLFFYLFFVMVA